MPKYVAFLRAINVGGRQVKMGPLADYFQTLGYGEVQTFLNTGNVIFQTPDSTPGPDSAPDQTSDPFCAQLAAQIETPLEALLGFRAEVFVRDERSLQAILATAAALQQPPNGGEINVALLKAPLTEVQALALAGLTSPMDTFLAQGSEVYWTCQVAQHGSKFSNALFERNLKLRSTLRRVTILKQLVDEFFVIA
jgi:uncharacterized protein (DUF1697 family)